MIQGPGEQDKRQCGRFGNVGEQLPRACRWQAQQLQQLWQVCCRLWMTFMIMSQLQGKKAAAGRGPQSVEPLGTARHRASE